MSLDFRGLLTAAAIAAVVVGGSVLPASAAEPGDATSAAPIEIDFSQLDAMGTYPEAQFERAAASLPQPLTDALAENPGISGAEYLARAEAGADASAVVDSLSESGVDVLGSRLEETTLVVNVATPDEAVAVEQTGAVAEIGEPEAIDLSRAADAKLMTDVSGGQAYYYEQSGSGYRCSIGFTGFNATTGAKLIATAGHCKGDSGYTLLTQSAPARNFALTSKRIGSDVPGSFQIGGGYDVGLIAVGSAVTPKPRVTTWKGSGGAPTTFTDVWDVTPAVVGAPMCKSGATSGWTCGVVMSIDEEVRVDDNRFAVNSIVTSACMLPGDSGGSALMGHSAIGINSWGTASRCGNSWTPTNQDGDYSGYSVLVSNTPGARTAAAKYGSGFEVAVAVAQPAISSPFSVAVIENDGVVSGTIAGGGPRHRVNIFVDGSTTPVVVPVSADGTWTTQLAGISEGIHSLRLEGRHGRWSKSTSTVTRYAIVGEPPLVAAMQSVSPGRSAIEISRSTFPAAAPVVYLTTGATKEILMSSISAGILSGGPVLIVSGDRLSGAAVAEISRLSPSRIVVAGDAGVVSDAFVRHLYALAPTVVRMARPQLDAVPLTVTLGAPFDPTTATQVYALAGVITPDASAPAGQAPAGQAPSGQAPSAAAPAAPAAPSGTAPARGVDLGALGAKDERTMAAASVLGPVNGWVGALSDPRVAIFRR